MDLALHNWLRNLKVRDIHALQTCTDMHDNWNRNPSWWHCTKSSQSGPITWLQLALLAMYGRRTMDCLTHHDHELNSKRQNQFTQSVLGPCTPWEQKYTFLFTYQFMVFLDP